MGKRSGVAGPWRGLVAGGIVRHGIAGRFHHPHCDPRPLQAHQDSILVFMRKDIVVNGSLRTMDN
jgi:hypothetical protein